MSDNLSKRTEYLCKDCKHSFVSLTDRIVSFGFPDSFSYKCRKSYKPASIEGDPVVGATKVAGGYETCRLTRLSSAICGHQGRLWSPKHKKDFFKLITKENY